MLVRVGSGVVASWRMLAVVAAVLVGLVAVGVWVAGPADAQPILLSSADPIQQLGQDIDGENAFNLSGGSVSLSTDGTRVAIGAPLNGGNGSLSGHTRIYQLSGNTWTQLGADIDGENAGDESGRSVSLSADGTRDDILDGGAGNDQLFGDADLNQNGDDTLTGGTGTDLLVGFAGNDTINAADGEQDLSLIHISEPTRPY